MRGADDAAKVKQRRGAGEGGGEAQWHCTASAHTGRTLHNASVSQAERGGEGTENGVLQRCCECAAAAALIGPLLLELSRLAVAQLFSLLSLFLLSLRGSSSLSRNP